jgi:hypothetical protein
MRAKVKIEAAFDEYHQAVFDFAYRLTRCADLAEDITQECFLALMRAPERFNAERGTLKTFLFAIARNLTLKNRGLSGRRPSTRPQALRAGPSQPDFECGGEHAIIGGIVASSLAAPVAMGAHRPAVARWRLCGVPGHTRDLLGCRRSRVRVRVGSPSAASHPIRHGHHLRLVRPA